MPNPLATAAKGKGLRHLLARAQAITSRYGLTSAKMDQALATLVNTLKRFDCQATLFVTAVTLARNKAVALKYHAQGIELAIHGLVHVDHTQLVLESQLAQLRRAQQLFEQAGIRTSGFRCPYLRSNADTVAALNENDFAYDSSPSLAWDVTDGLETDTYRRALDFYGAQAASDYPALPCWAGKVVRFPYCLPDDEALVERLRLPSGPAMSEIWLAILERTYTAGELFTLGLHPERAWLCQAALEATLAKARSLLPSVWIARLDEIDAWWRALSQTTFDLKSQDSGTFRIAIKAPSNATVLIRAVHAHTPAQPWTHSYQRVSEAEFTLQSSLRPVIGLSPDSPPALGEFVRQQGYLVEISADAQPFPVYLQRTSFGPDDQRPLLVQLENGDWPLVRLGRWPNGTQSALAITGDIDAFTLWDYGLRFIGH
jgi:peptidoglycan/xylan/chitin deacetylase (PgdA/CDA1 family)